MKLQHIFNGTIIPLVIIPLMILGWTANTHLIDNSRTRTFSQLSEVSSELKQQIDQASHLARNNLDLLSSDFVVQQYALTKDDASRYSIYQRGLLERFSHHQQSSHQYEAVRYILPDGYEDARWTRTPSFKIDGSAKDQSWFKILSRSDSTYFHYLEKNHQNSEWIVHFYKALKLAERTSGRVKPAKKLRGYLSISLPLQWLLTDIKQLGENTELIIALADAAGKPLLINTGLDDNDQQSMRSHVLETGQQDTYFAIDSLQLKGVKHYVEVTPVLGKYFLLVASPANASVVFDETLSSKVATITALSMLATISLLFLLLHFSVIRPLHALESASEAVGRGAFDTVIKLNGGLELRRLAGSLNKMTHQLRKASEKISYAANHDSLTQLPNRRMFLHCLKQAVASAQRSNESMALLFLDVDNFKNINDSLGHDVGDLLLTQFSTRLCQSLREEDTIAHTTLPSEEDLVARLGGDEFTIILRHVASPENAEAVARRIVEKMIPPFSINKQKMYVSTSIGIALYPDDAQQVDELIKCADIAMYGAKNNGKNNFRFYQTHMHDLSDNRVELENELRFAIKHGEMSVHYQPQVAIQHNKVYGFEALLRWQHPQKGFISPDQFIPLAEEIGLIGELGQWVMRKSCRTAQQWREEGLSDFKMSVNVSMLQFAQQDMLTQVKDILNETGLPPEYLTIEVTETIAMTSQESTLRSLRAIQALGVSTALDDFGTGYSSLSHLRKMPVDILKIDRAFIVEAQQQASVRKIVHAIIQMAHALDLKVVAEGIESVDQINDLKEMNCNVVQGFYYSKALPETEAKAFYETQIKGKFKPQEELLDLGPALKTCRYFDTLNR